MKTTIEVEGKEGDEPKFEEIDEDTVVEEKEKKTEMVKEVSHEWENRGASSGGDLAAEGR